MQSIVDFLVDEPLLLLFVVSGLGYALVDGLSFGECRSTGPGGRGGICLCRTAERFGFYPERQQWRKILNDKGLGLWVGYCNWWLFRGFWFTNKTITGIINLITIDIYKCN